jgi:hypothetical protein
MGRGDSMNAATDGLLIAHDVLEHVNGPHRIGSITDELEALGAIWYVRGQFHDLRRDSIGSAYGPHENVAADVTRMFRDYFHGGSLDHYLPRTLRCEVDDDLQEVMEAARRNYRGEVDPEPSELHEYAKARRIYDRIALARMRIGYRKAKRMYPDAHRVNALFWEITDAVNPRIKGCFEGQQFELRYGIRNGRAWAECHEQRDPYDY